MRYYMNHGREETFGIILYKVGRMSSLFEMFKDIIQETEASI